MDLQNRQMEYGPSVTVTTSFLVAPACSKHRKIMEKARTSIITFQSILRAIYERILLLW